MNLFKSPKVPKAPNPEETAAVAAKYNLDALRTNIAANRIDQTTPYGSLTWAPSGVDQFGNTTYSATTKLSPEQQALLDQLQGSQLSLGGYGGSLVDDFAAKYGGGVPDFMQMVSDPMTGYMGNFLKFQQPYFTKALENRENELINRGILPGTPAFEREMRTLRQSQDESVGMEMNKAFPMLTGLAQQNYTIPLEAIRAILGISGPANNLMFQNPSNITMPSVDFAGITKNTFDAQMQAYKAQLDSFQKAWGAVGGLVGAGLGLPTGVGSATIGGTLGSNIGSGLSSFLGLV